VAREKIVDLSAKAAPDGALSWDVPEGNWTIVRIGWTVRSLHEVDKMSREALDAFFPGVLEPLIKEARTKGYKSFTNILVDSWEVGEHNWTPAFRSEFLKRRGYDPLPWLVGILGPLDRLGYVPGVFAAKTIENETQTARFIRDYRRTMYDLLRENYFERFREFRQGHGMSFHVEPYGGGPFEPVSCAESGCDVPMGEFWSNEGGSSSTLKVAASAAHTTGRSVVGAEAFTSRKGHPIHHPFALKAIGDQAFAQGINKLFIHSYPHQPWMGLAPGMTMFGFDVQLHRNVTWWQPGAAWFQYLTRCQYLLRQGRAVNDVLCFAGESVQSDLSGLKVGRSLNLSPWEGYDIDFCSREMLLRATIRDGLVVLLSGAEYRVLSFHNPEMSLPVAEHLRRLTNDGATIVGPRPTGTPGLEGYPESDRRVRQIGEEMWGDPKEPVKRPATPRRCGKGLVYPQDTVRPALTDMKVGPDFVCDAKDGAPQVTYLHRKTSEADIYFLSNQSTTGQVLQCSFRVHGKQPELWHPDTGLIESVGAFAMSEAGVTSLPVGLDPYGSVFVVFRKPIQGRDHCQSVNAGARSALLTPRPQGREELSVTQVVKNSYAEEKRIGVQTTEPMARIRLGEDGVERLSSWVGGDFEVVRASGR
jgi:hypothetical protein